MDNSDLSLRPGMTGTAEITTVTRDDALLIPNAALRFEPPAAETAATSSGGSVFGSLMPRPPSTARKTSAPVTAEDGSKRVWVLRNGMAEPVQVRTGASDGRSTEIVGGDLEAGDSVITEQAGG